VLHDLIEFFPRALRAAGVVRGIGVVDFLLELAHA
jgi:hypothetical protein